MQNDFQIYTHRKLAELARWHQLQPCPLIESGNGTEYKNYLNDTVFTVYHGRLDEKNSGRIEVAVGIENIAAELSCAREIVETWFSRTQQMVHPAESKSPQRWPRFSIWSPEDVELLCRSFDLLFNNSENPLSPDNKSRPHIPPIDERIMPGTAQLVVSRQLGMTYQILNGCKVNLPANPALQPDASALMRHFKLWQAREQE